MNDRFFDLLIAVIWQNSFNSTNQNAGNNSLSVIAIRVALIEQAYVLTTL